jgi:hypothetical protein
MTGRLFNTSFIAVCAYLMSQALIGCAASPAPKPNAGVAAIVLEVVATPKQGAKANRFVRVPVYDAAPHTAAPSGQFELVNYSALDDVIVWLEPAGAGDAEIDASHPATPERAPLTLDVAASIHPDDVHAATVGQEIVFRNRGKDAVSLYSVSDDNDFDLPAIPPGGEARYTAREAGMIEVLADPSDPPVAMVYVVSSPWVTRTRSGGHVVFKDVAPGSYEASAWHPRLPGKSTPVTLTPGAVARVELNVGVNVLAEQQP